MRLDVVTPRGPLLGAEVEEVTAPGVEGEFGVLAGHIPFLTGIRPGVLSWRGIEGGGSLAVGPGFAEIANDRIIVLTDAGMRIDEIDVAAARKECSGAQSKLDHWDGEDSGARTELEATRNWAQARLDAAGAGPALASH